MVMPDRYEGSDESFAIELNSPQKYVDLLGQFFGLVSSYDVPPRALNEAGTNMLGIEDHGDSCQGVFIAVESY